MPADPHRPAQLRSQAAKFRQLAAEQRAKEGLNPSLRPGVWLERAARSERVAERSERLAAEAEARAAGSASAAASPQLAVPAPVAEATGALRSELAGIPNTVLLAGGAAVVGGAAIAGGAYLYSRRRKKRSSKRSPKRSSSKRGRSGARLGSSKRRNRRGGAVKDRYGGRKVYRTKRGQPYVLLASGKARFIKA